MYQSPTPPVLASTGPQTPPPPQDDDGPQVEAPARACIRHGARQSRAEYPV